MVSIDCLSCGKVFDRKGNGKKMMHYEKDNSIMYKKKKLICACGSTELRFHNLIKIRESDYPK